jgi:hypothetical protein
VQAEQHDELRRTLHSSDVRAQRRGRPLCFRGGKDVALTLVLCVASGATEAGGTTPSAREVRQQIRAPKEGPKRSDAHPRKARESTLSNAAQHAAPRAARGLTHYKRLTAELTRESDATFEQRRCRNALAEVRRCATTNASCRVT